MMHTPEVVAQDLSRLLQDQYQNRILVIRNFYAGRSLHFGPKGSLLSKAASGDWTTDGFVQIAEVKASRQILEIRATRLELGWVSKSGFTILNRRDSQGTLDKKEKKAHELQIQADLDPLNPQPETLLSQIFLTRADSFGDVMPSYWKVCVDDGLLGGANLSQTCSFSSELRDVPSLRTVVSGAPQSSGPQGGPQPRILPDSKIEKGVTPPHATFYPEPPFTDQAHSRRFQGTVILSMRIDETGRPRDVQVKGPLGCGLDAQAIRVVQGWRFLPARKDGSPVSFQVTVEINFHLY